MTMFIPKVDYNISDISSFKDIDFYTETGSFLTISDFIATYEDHPQTVFNVLAYHDKDASPLEIEKGILRNAVYTVEGDMKLDETEMGIPLITQLVKLSSCTHWMEKYQDKEREKIKKFTERQNGKWWFQPDQRCPLVQELCDEDDTIACEVMSMKDWYISRGLDPVQEDFNRILIDCFNDKRINQFKDKYQNLIIRTFGDIKEKEIA